MKNLAREACLCLVAILVILFTPAKIQAAMTIQSLSGAVTATEINSFKTYVQGLSFPTTQSYNDEWATGTTGRAMEAMGMMYEVSRDSGILDRMIQFSEGALALRNDFTDKRVMWTGNVEPVWLTKASTDPAAGYSGCESGEILGNIAYCARLILQTPSLWNTTCPVGSTKYGTTYLQKANNYITNCEYSMDQYFNVWFPDSTTHRIKNSTQLPTAWQNLNQSIDAWNRQFMFLNAWQRLAECHLLLGDNAAKVTRYEQIVTAAQQYMLSQVTTTIAGGQICYTWTYETGQAGGNEELNQHAEYDMWGMSRIYVSGRYGLSQANMRPFCEDLRNIIYQGNNVFAEWVNGDTSTTRTYIYPGWMGISANDPCVYTIMATPDSASSHVASGADFDSQILWTKNARAIGQFPNNCDAADFSLTSSWFETVNAGSNATCSVTVNPLAGFSSAVMLNMTGLPAGVTASFTSGNNSTLTLTASSSAASGTYSVNISGTGDGITRIVPVTLVVTTSGTLPNFTIFATPSSQNVTNGGGTNYTMTVGSVNGFSDTVNLSVSGLPAHANGSFSPASITGGAGSSTLNISTAANTPSGNYTLTITGVSGTLTNSATATLTVTLVNLALNQTATASSTWSASYPASYAIDGNTGTRWSAASGQTNNQWLMVDFGAATIFDSVVIKEISFPRITAFKIQSSTDGTTFTDLASGTIIGASLTVPFSPVFARYVRLYELSASDVPTINEFEVYYSGAKPRPAIVSAGLIGTNFMISGTNGIAGATCYLLGTTNAALPLNQWTPVTTNEFGPNGNFSVTNQINNGTPNSFFLIQY
jgi:F5/8 type C domain